MLPDARNWRDRISPSVLAERWPHAGQFQRMRCPMPWQHRNARVDCKTRQATTQLMGIVLEFYKRIEKKKSINYLAQEKALTRFKKKRDG